KPCRRRDGSLEREDETPLTLAHRQYRQAISTSQQSKAFQLFFSMFSQFREGDHPVESAHERDVDHVPARLVRRAVRIVVWILRIEGGGVGIGGATDLDDTGDA